MWLPKNLYSHIARLLLSTSAHFCKLTATPLPPFRFRFIDYVVAVTPLLATSRDLMYSDDDDSGDDRGMEFYASPPSSPAALVGGTMRTDAAAKTRSTYTTSMADQAARPAVGEDETLPESYLERCAVIFDASMLGSANIHPKLTGSIVEIAYTVLHNPLASEGGWRVTKRAARTIEPHVDARNMQRKEKEILLNDVAHRVKKMHGVACHVSGVEKSAWQLQKLTSHRTYFATVGLTIQLPENETFTMDKVEQHTSKPDSQAALKGWVEEMCQVATVWCRAEGRDEAIAFLTLQGSCAEEARQALLYIQTELGVKLPRYRIFTLEAVIYGQPEPAPASDALFPTEETFAGAEGLGGVTGTDGRKHLNNFREVDPTWEMCTCPYHRCVALQEHGFRFKCCYWTTDFITRILLHAGELIEQASSRQAAGPVSAGVPVYEDE